MALRFGLVLKNQRFRLALKVIIVSLALLWLRRIGPATGPGLLFFVVFNAVYWRHHLNSRKFFLSALVLFALPLFLPLPGGRAEFLFALVWGLALYLLLGVKELAFVRRENLYQILHLILVIGLATLFFLGIMPQIIFFIVLFFLFREFYLTLAPHYPQRLALIAAAGAFIILETAWVVSFLPLGFLAAAAFIALMVFISYDLLLYHLNGTLSRQIILRNAALFVVLSLIIMVLPG